MNHRRYNIYFHTHTISGIIISALLFVIFFAGSFAFFKNEISAWQKNTPNQHQAIDFNQVADTIATKYNLYGREVSMGLNEHSRKLRVFISESKDTVNNKGAGGYFQLDPQTFKSADYESGYDLGEFMYRLHFFAPMNSIGNFGFPLGYYISGTVAFIFLFALITGLLVHWKKIVSNFYVFRPWEKLKTIWTDLHTALGVITFPFLFVFAVTGAYFLISYPLFTQPTVSLQYEGKQDSLFAELGYGSHDLVFRNQPAAKPEINGFVAKAQQQWGSAFVNKVEILNYGDSSMQVHVGSILPYSEKFVSKGEMVFDVVSGKMLKHSDPKSASSYSDIVENTVYSLHFGEYGGYLTKLFYFLLAICSCMVIISGVLIWLVARDKNNIPEKKRKFNLWLTRVYLAICMSMYPVTAATFIAVRIKPDGGMHYIYSFYFYSWLAVSIAFLFKKDIYKICRDALLAGSIIGITIPVINGLFTGNWIWKSYANHYNDIMLIDLFWVLVSSATFICWLLMRRKKSASAGNIIARPA